jgi:hypothetical protein
MVGKRKFSLAAKFLIFLLALRFIGQLYLLSLGITSNLNLFVLLYLGIVVLLIVFYGVSLVGVIKKTSWGIKFVIFIAIFDVIVTGAMGLINGTLGSISSIGGIIFDLILLFLAGNISRRIKAS